MSASFSFAAKRKSEARTWERIVDERVCIVGRAFECLVHYNAMIQVAYCYPLALLSSFSQKCRCDIHGRNKTYRTRFSLGLPKPFMFSCRETTSCKQIVTVTVTLSHRSLSPFIVRYMHLLSHDKLVVSKNKKPDMIYVYEFVDR